MTEPASLSERVARAICRAGTYCDLDSPDGMHRWRLQRDMRRMEAQAAIRATLDWIMEPDDDLRFAANDISDGFEQLTGEQVMLICQAMLSHIKKRECGE